VSGSSHSRISSAMEASSSSNRPLSAPHIARMRTNSSNSIQFHQEVTVFSNQNAQIQRDAPPVAIDIRNHRPTPNPTYSDKKGKRVIDRRLSEPPGILGGENSHGRHLSEDDFSRRDLRDPAMGQSNREAMRALADFLTTTSPPGTDLSPKDSEVELKSSKSTKKSPFKMFARIQSKKEKAPESSKPSNSLISVSQFFNRMVVAVGNGLLYRRTNCTVESSMLTSQAYNWHRCSLCSNYHSIRPYTLNTFSVPVHTRFRGPVCKVLEDFSRCSEPSG
jgi:hypothetical protein